MDEIRRRSNKGFGIGGVVMEEYLKTLLEQIRCKKACPMIEEEIRSHIEEQARANMEEGMNEEEAMEEAVLDMGDPVETGVALDAIHRPQIAWDMILLMAVVSLASIAIHTAIGMGAEEIGAWSWQTYVLKSVGYVGIGFLLMLLVYHLDYSILGKYGKLLALGCLAGIFFLSWSMFMTTHLTSGTQIINGQLYISIGVMAFSPKYLAFLYVPVYGAVLYQYRKTGWRGIIGALLLMAVPVWFVWHIPCVSAAVQLLLILSVMLTVAVWKDWFLIPKKIFLGIYWGIMVLLPVVIAVLAVRGSLFAPYQQARLQMFLNGSYNELDYVGKMLSDYLAGSHLFGASDLSIAGNLPDYYSNYILTFLSGCYGIAAACAICLLVCVVAARALRISLGQKNQLGMIIGLGCSLVLFSNTVINVAENFRLLPTTGSFLPFFSHSGSGIIVSYILIGFVLSVYRYKNIPLNYQKRNLSVHTDF